ncbi:hypothetical protein [Legionella feeleii]|uniref:Uncharacterized protein n=1 Tax=Legionella feeleii TaxID=453 RepID=A0A0W0TN57_9GAMM|nr:hypothetical protein [Legionella feeleii]KTC97011.1 hypothetical protein Lfee_1923 [Legionella feeleii]SPX61621.1 Uncharacterised protein [Legionella feeleii]
MKQTLVLSPGVSGDSGLWQHQMNHLQEVVDIKVIVVKQANNLPGYGRLCS